METVAECSGLQVRFDNLTVLQDLDLQISRGDFVAIMGPSGCGKTTLLRALSGLLEPTSGSVQLLGKPPAAQREKTAIVFQEPVLLPWLSLADNIALPMRLRGWPRQRRNEETQELARLVELHHALDRRPNQLSGGMSMRAALARALALHPEILFFDEPFAALDAWTRRRLNTELLRLRQERSFTALFVTHSIQEAIFLSNRILLLSPGKPGFHCELPGSNTYPRPPDFREGDPYRALEKELVRLLEEVEDQKEEP